MFDSLSSSDSVVQEGQVQNPVHDPLELLAAGRSSQCSVESPISLPEGFTPLEKLVLVAEVNVPAGKVTVLDPVPPAKENLWAGQTKGVSPGAVRSPSSYETGARVKGI